MEKNVAKVRSQNGISNKTNNLPTAAGNFFEEFRFVFVLVMADNELCARTICRFTISKRKRRVSIHFHSERHKDHFIQRENKLIFFLLQFRIH